MLIEQIPAFVRWFFGPVLWRKDAAKKVLYLTFDDGPTEENTRWILDVLDEKGIKATFFCIGKNVERLPVLYQEIQQRGHQVGLHGYDHKRGLYKQDAMFMADIDQGASLITSRLFRPPHGHITLKQVKKLSKRFTIVLWDVITRDYNPQLAPEKVLRIAKHYARNGSVIVFHDSRKAQLNMRYAFPRAVDYWIEKGYKFDTL